MTNVTRPRVYELSGTPPTHGRIVLMSPWARAGINSDDRHAVEAVVPPGYTINVLVTGNRAYWSLRVTGPSGYESRSLRLSHGMPLRAALLYALGHWGLGRGETVTTDGAGNVTSWEDAS